LLQIAYLILIILFGVIANLKPDISTVIGTLGLGGLGVGANYEKIQSSVSKFLKDRRTLKDTVVVLRLKLNGCDPSDDKCLDEVQRLYEEILKKLTGSS